MIMQLPREVCMSPLARLVCAGLAQMSPRMRWRLSWVSTPAPTPSCARNVSSAVARQFWWLSKPLMSTPVAQRSAPRSCSRS